MPFDSIDEIIKRREQRLVSKDNPGTIVQMEELEQLSRYINQNVILVIGSYEWDDEDWSTLTNTERKILLEGILGYQIDKDYVITHLVGSGKDFSEKDENAVYIMTAWHDLIEKVKSEKGEILFENAHDSFYFRGSRCGPDSNLCEYGPNFHSQFTRMKFVQKAQRAENYFLRNGLLGISEDFSTRDLERHKIIRLDPLVKNKKEDTVDPNLKEH